jgi:TIR domain/Pentapeptide repeats (8 copies)
MANPEHLAILKQGVEVWNRLMVESPKLPIDLRRADLAGMDLTGIKLMSAWLDEANLQRTDLRSSDLRSVSLRRANLQSAKLSAALMTHVRLSESNLESAELFLTNLSHSDLSGSNLTDAALIETNLNGANLHRANLTAVRLNGTVLTGACPADVVGLAACLHLGPTVIDFYTYTVSGGLPVHFMRGCGLPDNVIRYLPSLLSSPIQFYSCFISYSTKDQQFADRLHADLQNKDVRCWLATEDLKIGDPFRQRIDEAIRVHDKLLLVLSESSITSGWVEDEVESAFERETRESRLVLFPIRLDDAVMDSEKAWAAKIRRTRHIGNFSNWRDTASYQAAFQRLLRDLKAEGKDDK